MCKYCEKLLNVPNDKKESVVLQNHNSTDAVVDKVIMQLNHDEDGTPYAFISHHLTIESTARSYHKTIEINYCPFCGEKII